MSRAMMDSRPILLRALLPALVLFSFAPPAVLLAQMCGSPEADGGNAVIRSGDVVKLTVYRHEDLTGDFQVNQFGVVALPRMGDVDVTRETHRSLRERVIRELSRTVVSPTIEVIVAKRVRVLGQVNQAGVYYLDPTMTVADAIGIAGGTSPTARRDTVMLRRDGATVVADLAVDTRVTDSCLQSGDEIVVPERGWLSRNGTTLVTATAAFAGIIVALVAR